MKTHKPCRRNRQDLWHGGECRMGRGGTGTGSVLGWKIELMCPPVTGPGLPAWGSYG